MDAFYQPVFDAQHVTQFCVNRPLQTHYISGPGHVLLIQQLLQSQEPRNDFDGGQVQPH